MQGKLIGIKVDNDFVPCESNCTLVQELETLPASSSANGNYRNSIAGYRSWSMEVSGRFIVSSSSAGVMELSKKLKSGATVEVVMTNRVDVLSTFSYYGNALVTNINIEAGVNGMASWSGTFKGVGELHIIYDDFLNKTIINAMPIEDDKPIYIDTTQW